MTRGHPCVQGIGQALYEGVHYDGETGQLLTGSLLDYAIPRADVLPPIWSHLQGTPSPTNPLGVKGRIPRDSGIEPAPQRGERTSWGTFLATHWEALAAADFFTVEVLTLGGLVRYFVFVVMRLKTRTVEIEGITCQPTEAG